MNIYNPQGILLADTTEDSSYLQYNVMSDHNVTVTVESPEPINFTVGCYLDFLGIRYTVRKKSDIQKDGVRQLRYTIIFESPQADAYKRTVRNPSTKKLKFPLTATPKEHAEVIVWNLNQISGGWQIGECIEAPHALVSYNHTKCWDAIKTIADTFNTEFEFDCYNKKLHIRKVEYNKDNPLPLAYGRGNGFKPGIGRKSVDSRVPIEILAVQAGSRNIDASKNDNHPELFLPKGQTIAFDGVKFEDEEGFDISNAKTYMVDAEGLTIQRADKELVTYEDSSTDLSNIYPMRVGTVTAVEVTDQGFYNIIDSTIPENLNYGDYRINGQEMIMIFQKAKMLSGREFKIVQTDKKLTGYNHELRRFMLVPDEQDGQTIPNDVFAPEVGDTYAVFGMMMPDEYIRDDESKSGASWDMFREAVKVLYEEEQEKFSFTGELNGLWAKRDWENIGGKLVLGGYIRFTDNQIIESGEDNVLIRITGIKQFLNDPYSPMITLANVTAATYNDDFRKIPENVLKAETDNKNTVNLVKRTWRGAMELINNLYDPSGDFQQKVISSLAVRALVGVFGDKLLQYTYWDANFQVEQEPVISFNKATKQFSCDAAYIRHETLGFSEDTVQGKQREDYHYWKVNAFPPIVLDQPDKFYYLYLKVSKSLTPDANKLNIGIGDWYLSTDPIDFEGDTHYYLWAASINSEEDEERQITLMHGFAEITPNMLRINNIASLDGETYWKLLENKLKIGDLDFNVSKPNALTLGNVDIVIKDKETGEIITSIDGNTGDAIFGRGAHLLNADKSLSLADKGIVYDLINGLKISGRFESNKDGYRAVIDPETNSIQLLMNDDIAAMLSFYEYEGKLIPSLRLLTEDGQDISSTLLRAGEVRFSGRGFDSYYGSNGFQVTNTNSSSLDDQVAYIVLDSDGELRVRLDKIATSPDLLPSGRVWRDGTYLRIVE